MTVCIAAACDGGKRIVTATDGMLSAGSVTADTLLGKMFWLGDWQFMYAGTPANVALISGIIEEMSVDNPDTMSRRKIQHSVSSAYRKFVANFSSFETLNAFDMTLEEFKKNGLVFFGADFHGELAKQIKDTARLVEDQLLVTGWGVSPISAMVYEVGPNGHWLHSAACFSAIGSGSQMALAMLMQMAQRRESTIAETIFNVACAKFSSEKSAGLDVGHGTAICISRKRSEEDQPGKPCVDFLKDEDTAKLRGLWEEYIKPRIPDEAWKTIIRISASVSKGQTSTQEMVEMAHAAERVQEAKNRTYEEIKAVIERDLQPPKADPSDPPPSPGSPEESDES